MLWIRPQLTSARHCFPRHNSARKWGAVKMHTPFKLQSNIPTFLHIFDEKLYDVNILDLLPLESGAFMSWIVPILTSSVFIV